MSELGRTTRVAIGHIVLLMQAPALVMLPATTAGWRAEGIPLANMVPNSPAYGKNFAQGVALLVQIDQCRTDNSLIFLGQLP